MDVIKQYLNEFRISEFNIPSFRAIDLLDIFIVAFLIYQIVVWIKETRAWSLFKGILVIFLFSIIAITFNLSTILWILSNAVSVGIIAIIIVFQPELRKALEQLGKGHFLSNILTTTYYDDENNKCSAKSFTEIINAVYKMSKVNTGALILIEQDVPLGDIESTGISVDAVITAQLIVNIFEHNTPLHDGAVIIKNNRIAAASCLLPLTESKISAELGTRHRAAVGASDVSDAFVIIVSEETGHVSVAKGGTLYRNKKEDEVKRLFYGTEVPVKKKRPIWKRRGR